MKLMTKASLATATAAVLLTALTGCALSGGAPQATESQVGTTNASKIESIADLVPAGVATAGTLKVGTSASSPPEGFKTEAGGLDGYEVQLVNAIGDVLGLEVDWQVSDFASLIPGLNSNRFDLAAGQIGITKDRAEIVDFVTLVMTSQSFATAKDSDIKEVTIEDLCGRNVAVMQGSRQQDFGTEQSKDCEAAGKPAVNLSVFQNTNDSWLSMRSKRTEIYWAGSTNVAYLVNSSDDAQIVGQHLTPYPTGLALSKDSEMGPAIEAALQSLVEDGSYGKILQEWGIQDSAVTRAELNPEITW